MDKKRIDNICCYHPYGFYICWFVLLGWTTLNFYWWGYCQYQLLLDLIGIMAFGTIFIFIIGTFGTISGKKEFLNNIFDGITNHFNKLLLYESLIILLSLAISIILYDPINRSALHLLPGAFPLVCYLFVILISTHWCIHLSENISNLILEKYKGKIVTLCTDVVLLPNLLVFVIVSGYHDIAKLMVISLVYHFLYTLFRLVHNKA